jgi:hypothetical protein
VWRRRHTGAIGIALGDAVVGREPDQGDPKTKEGRPQAAFKEKL